MKKKFTVTVKSVGLNVLVIVNSVEAYGDYSSSRLRSHLFYDRMKKQRAIEMIHRTGDGGTWVQLVGRDRNSVIRRIFSG